MLIARPKSAMTFELWWNTHKDQLPENITVPQAIEEFHNYLLYEEDKDDEPWYHR